MSKNQKTLHITLKPEDNQRLAILCGPGNASLRQIEKRLKVKIKNRGHEFNISGEPKARTKAAKALQELFLEAEGKQNLNPTAIHLTLKNIETNLTTESNTTPIKTSHIIRTRQMTVKPRSPNQTRYLENISQYHLTFGVGPAGTGKTYLAVACAVAALEKEEVQRIILIRPAIEAGEKLGFLPGDIAQKVDPYLRPLYDALYEMLGINYVEKLIAHNIIEIAPLAFMRGRTLNDAFIILDESQNTTIEQMKMLLTRIGFGSKAVITGDITQIDLPHHITSGLKHALAVLEKSKAIAFSFFATEDVVRHPLVQDIIEAYTEYEHAKKIDN
jgi:phosphate starvation-inducible protein PhoH and related proteins